MSPAITFSAKIVKIGTNTILHLPASASSKLPSRGMVMVEGTVNGKHDHYPLEPDGKKGHWCKIAGKAGDTVTAVFDIVDNWPEPTIPADLKKMLASSPKANATWKATTVMARWDWIRWVRATKNPDTRKKHITVALSKLTSGMKRPCCFNRAMCTDFTICTNGVLK